MDNVRRSSSLIERARILVVEDDAMVRSIVVEYLQAFGFKRIVAADSSRHAVRLLNDQGEGFDLVLSDWQMPGVDGLDLLRLSRKIPYRQAMKFIMITSQVPEERIKIAKARQAGVDAYIVKPFKGRLLRDKIWEVLGWGSGGNNEAKA